MLKHQHIVFGLELRQISLSSMLSRPARVRSITQKQIDYQGPFGMECLAVHGGVSGVK